MGRPSKWNSPTESVRLPSHVVPLALALAKQLDQPPPAKDDGFVQNKHGPYMVAIETVAEIERYIIEPPDVSQEVWEQAEQAVNELCSDLSFEERMWLLADLTKRCCRKVKL